MRSIFFIMSLFFAFTINAKGQDENDRFQKQPPPVTQAQVEKDAALAQQERKKHEEEKKISDREDNKKPGNTQIAPVATNTTAAKKTSTRPGKQ